jgi:hypothetical protein
MSSKMNINKNNYEAWFLDYFENQLNAEQVAELFLFLEQNPQFQEEFDAFENTVLPQEFLEQEILQNKESLKKFDFVCDANINDWLIAQAEGELNPQQLQSLEHFLAENPAFLNDQKLIAKTKLVSDPVERFELKSKLKQISVVTTSNIQAWLIAELQGDLNLQDRTLLKDFLAKHPEYTLDKDNYHKTILPAANEETYPHKKKLRRGAVIPFYQQRSFYRIAALILLVLGAGIVFTIYQNNNRADQHIAEVKDSIQIPANVQGSEPSVIEKQYAAVDTTSKSLQPSSEKTISNPKVPSTNYSVKENLAERKSPLKNKPESMPADNHKATLEEIPALTLKGTPTLPVREPYLFAERRYTPKATIEYENPNEPPSLLEILNPSRITSEVIDLTAKEINKVAGEELVSSPENPLRLPFKSRVLKFIAKTVGKISNDKVKVRTSFNPITGKLSAYEIETGKKTIQRQFETHNY